MTVAPIFSLLPPSQHLRMEEPARRADATQSFSTLFNGFIENANGAMDEDNEYTRQLLCGQLQNTHQAGISAGKSEVTLHLIAAISSRLSSATTTMLQMQV